MNGFINWIKNHSDCTVKITHTSSCGGQIIIGVYKLYVNYLGKLDTYVYKRIIEKHEYNDILSILDFMYEQILNKVNDGD